MKKKEFNPAEWRETPGQAGGDGTKAGSGEIADEIERLTQAIEARRADITGDYRRWLDVGFALKEALGEAGRSYFHRISHFYPGYSEEEADTQYDKCMRSKGEGVNPPTLFYLAGLEGIKISGKSRTSVTGSIRTASDGGADGVTGTTKTATDGDKTGDVQVKTPARGFEGFEGLREKRMPTFSQKVRGGLPGILEEVAANANSDEDADLLILGSIATLSACLPNVSGVYGDRPVFPNLFLFVAAPASAGKGRLTLCRRLAQPIQDRLRSLHEEDMARYRKAKAEYERRRKRDPSIEPPEEPKRRTLFIPANSSATMVYQILSENGGGGLMFETEGDTLAVSFKSDFGDYSDGFRKAFHHEPISYTRRKDQEFVELPQPRLSAVLSGTPRQIAALIPDTENGLFSRFIFYCLDFRLEWLDMFPRHRDDDCMDETFDRIGKRVLTLHQSLQSGAGVRFLLTAGQKKDFNDRFRELQRECYGTFGDDIIASVRRMGLITYRIAMILSVLRMADGTELPRTLYCHDGDFRSALDISRTLMRHTCRVYRGLSSHELYKPAAEGSRRRGQLLEALPEEFGTAEAIEAAGKMGISQKSVERYLKEWREAGLIGRVAHGRYRKPEAAASGNPQTPEPSKPSREGMTFTNPTQNDDIQTQRPKEDENFN